MTDKPVTREEKYLAYLTGDYTGEIPKPITRKEKYLYELCLKGIGGEISPEEIKNAVNEYLEKNPVKPGATTEQAQQVEQNKTDIGSLKEETGSLKEDISNKITKFYASNQGEAHITDSDNGKIQDMMIYGKSEQFTTTGKNLLKIKDGTQTTRGVTVTAKDGVVALKGTATETGWTILDIDSFVLDGTCILSANTHTNVVVILANKSFEAVLEQNKSNALENAEASKVCFIVTEGKTYDISNILIQIEKGSVATSYEPYTGGIPSPSPDYPQEIKSVVNPTVKIVGKNLLSYASCELGNTSGIDGTLGDNNDYIRSQFVKVWPGKVITLSAAEGYVTHKIVEYDANNAMVKNNESGTANVITITLNKNTVKARTVVRLKETGVIPDEKDIQIQLEYGITRTAYKPYHEQTVTLPYTLNAIPVSSGGNVTIDGQQYVADYVDVERGKLVKMVDSSKLDNTQSIVNKTEWLLAEPQEIDLTQEEVQTLKALATYYPTTNISINSEQLDGYTVFNYPISMQNGWNYVKQQLNDNRDYIYDMDLQSAEAYVNSEYTVALTELEV